MSEIEEDIRYLMIEMGDIGFNIDIRFIFNMGQVSSSYVDLSGYISERTYKPVDTLMNPLEYWLVRIYHKELD